MYVHSSTTSTILISICRWHQNDWKETEYGSHSEEIDETCWSWWTNIISWPRVFGMLLNVNANRMKLLLSNAKKCLNHVFLLEQLKNYQGGPNLTKNSCVVLRHGRTCSKMRWEILRAGKQKDRAVLCGSKSLLGWWPFQGGGTWISWRSIKSMLTIFLQMLVLGTNW